jgi:hypothetical protein
MTSLASSPDSPSGLDLTPTTLLRMVIIHTYSLPRLLPRSHRLSPRPLSGKGQPRTSRVLLQVAAEPYSRKGLHTRPTHRHRRNSHRRFVITFSCLASCSPFPSLFEDQLSRAGQRADEARHSRPIGLTAVGMVLDWGVPMYVVEASHRFPSPPPGLATPLHLGLRPWPATTSNSSGKNAHSCRPPFFWRPSPLETTHEQLINARLLQYNNKSVLSSFPGLQNVISECPGLHIYVGAVDQEVRSDSLLPFFFLSLSLCPSPFPPWTM